MNVNHRTSENSDTFSAYKYICMLSIKSQLTDRESD